jgi:membrane protein DedA with SNARE-associated domain
MSDTVRFVANHGYFILFAAIFSRQIGLPVPAFPFLLAAGALAAAGRLALAPSIGLTVAACALADWVWFEAGRLRGDNVLHFMHRFTRDPDLHDRRAKRIFARYGPPLLLVAKFVPGFDAVAPPLAGISRTSRVRFLAFDAVGSGIYACVYCGLGYLFSNDLDRATAYVSRAGSLLLASAMIGICIYMAYHKLIQRIHLIRESRVLRILTADALECGDPVEMACGVVGGQEHGD